MKWRLYVYFSLEKIYKAKSPCFLKKECKFNNISLCSSILWRNRLNLILRCYLTVIKSKTLVKIF
jgi:hypothetical protein